jgi:hypothetical protein
MNMNMHQDEAFLHLLSSQRELLSQLHMEQQQQQQQSMRGGGRGGGGTSSYYGGGRGGGNGGGGMHFHQHHPGMMMMNRAADSYLNRPPTGIHSNHSIAGGGYYDGGRSNNADIVLAKRLSIGFGADTFVLSTSFRGEDRADGAFGFGDEQGDGDLKLFKDAPSSTFKSKRAPEGMEEAQFYKKRRLSSIGFYSSSFFDDGLEQSRRGSMSFMSKLASITAVTSKEAQSSRDDDTASNLSENKRDEDETIGDHHNDNDDDDDDASIASVPVEPIELEMADVNPAKFKTVCLAFTTSMEKSAKSQQDIHDWDRKMGLKRSHSKTMRQSSRSRKKLRAILKKEMMAMSKMTH